jgi:hypothetical protein
MSHSSQRPAWAVPTLVVAVIAVAYFAVRLAMLDSEQPAFPTEPVAAPSTAPGSDIPTPADHRLTLSATGLGQHRFGDAEAPVVDALTAVLGTPTEDAEEECAGADQARLIRWADLTVRFDSGEFVAYVEGIYYPPGPPPLAIPTAEGLAPGDRATRLFELYDRALLTEVTPPAQSDQEITQFEITGDGPRPHVVVIQGPLESGRVVAISAGSLCQSS